MLRLPRSSGNVSADLPHAGKLDSYAALVGWAKPSDANASGGVPTIRRCVRIKMVGTAQGAFAHLRLTNPRTCTYYGTYPRTRHGTRLLQRTPQQSRLLHGKGMRRPRATGGDPAECAQRRAHV